MDMAPEVRTVIDWDDYRAAIMTDLFCPPHPSISPITAFSYVNLISRFHAYYHQNCRLI
jgi:hypothetical protein